MFGSITSIIKIMFFKKNEMARETNIPIRMSSSTSTTDYALAIQFFSDLNNATDNTIVDVLGRKPDIVEYNKQLVQHIVSRITEYGTLIRVGLMVPITYADQFPIPSIFNNSGARGHLVRLLGFSYTIDASPTSGTDMYQYFREAKTSDDILAYVIASLAIDADINVLPISVKIDLRKANRLLAHIRETKKWVVNKPT